MQRKLLLFLLAILVLVVASTAFAENPWAGKWKLDTSQSKLTGDTIHFASGADGEMMYTAAGHTSKFKTDGKSYTTWSGAEATWKQVDDHTWESRFSRNGTDLATDTWTLSPDGKDLKLESKGTRPDGSAFDDTSSYTRSGEGRGLAGDWKNTSTSISEDQTMELEANGDNGIVWTLPEMKAKVDAKMDGKDYPAEGPTVPKGITLALMPVSAHSFKMTEKMNGMPMWNGTYTLSEDGKTMTAVGSPAKTNEPTTEVYTRQ